MERILRSPLLRLAPVAVCAVAIQQAVFANHRIADVVVQFTLALAVGIGAGAGAQRGMVGAFALGLLYDLRFDIPVGSTSLAYGLAALTAGYVLGLTPDPQWWLSSLFATIGAIVGYATEIGVRLFLGEQNWLGSRLPVQFAVVVGAAAVLSPMMVPIGRWSMGVRRKTWKAMVE